MKNRDSMKFLPKITPTEESQGLECHRDALYLTVLVAVCARAYISVFVFANSKIEKLIISPFH